MSYRAWLSVVTAASACASDPEWPPPPDNAAATCVYAYQAPTPYTAIMTSTLYMDGDDRVFRVDGKHWDDGDSRWVKATYEMQYDDLGRLVEEHDGAHSTRYAYGANEIDVTGYGGEFTIELVNDRVVRWRNKYDVIDYGYDSLGRLITYDSAGRDVLHVKYAYDAQDRVIKIERTITPGYAPFTYLITYTETPDQLLVEIDEPPYELRFDFDAQHRITHESVKFETINPGAPESTYVYGDGFVEETSAFGTIRATGDKCPAPRLGTSRRLPVPIEWGADYVRFASRAELELRVLY